MERETPLRSDENRILARLGVESLLEKVRGRTTLLELIHLLLDARYSEAEMIKAVAYLVNSGCCTLRGTFAGRKIDL